MQGPPGSPSPTPAGGRLHWPRSDWAPGESPACLWVAAGPRSRSGPVAAADETTRHWEAAWAARLGRRVVTRAVGPPQDERRGAERGFRRAPQGEAGRGGAAAPSSARGRGPEQGGGRCQRASAAAAATTSPVSRRAGVAADAPSEAPWASPGVAGDGGPVARPAGSKPAARPSSRRRFGAGGFCLPSASWGRGGARIAPSVTPGSFAP